MEIKCSVIIPAYNAEKTIEKCLTSIVSKGQKEPLIEIIVVDDGSQDKTFEKVQEMAKSHSEIRVVRKENGGVSSARNYGIAQAKGKYVFFADADDELIRETLDEMIFVAEEKNVDLVVADYYKCASRSKEKEYVSSEIETGEILSREYIEKTIFDRYFTGRNNGLSNIWNKLFHLSLIQERNMRFDEKRTHGEDWKFNIEYFSSIQNLCAIAKPVFMYKLDGTQGYTKYRKGLSYSLLDGHQTAQNLNEKYLRHKKDSSQYVSFMSKFAGQSLQYLSLRDCSKKEKKEFLSAKEERELWKFMSGLKDKQLRIAEYSRRDKFAFFLLRMKRYKWALKLLKI